MTSSTALVQYVYTASHHLQSNCSEVRWLLSVQCEVCPLLYEINQAVAHRGVALRREVFCWEETHLCFSALVQFFTGSAVQTRPEHVWPDQFAELVSTIGLL